MSDDTGVKIQEIQGLNTDLPNAAATKNFVLFVELGFLNLLLCLLSLRVDLKAFPET